MPHGAVYLYTLRVVGYTVPLGGPTALHSTSLFLPSIPPAIWSHDQPKEESAVQGEGKEGVMFDVSTSCAL